jgi:hypothetical protein
MLSVNMSGVVAPRLRLIEEENIFCQSFNLKIFEKQKQIIFQFLYQIFQGTLTEGED